MDDAFAEEVEAGAAVHLPFDCLDPVDVAFGGAGAVGQGQSGGDRGQVEADSFGEGVQFGLVVSLGALEPSGQLLFSGALGHHLGEAGHVLGEAARSGCR
jgi:hypothetical protein